MNTLYQFLSGLSAYRSLIAACMLVVGLIIIFVLVASAFKHMSDVMKAEQERRNDESMLKNIDYEELEKSKKASVLRSIVAPDGIDPGPNSYTIVNDGGEDVYIRTLTIVTMPRRDKFATTFAPLLDFPDCTSSVFISPISEENMIHKMDRHITVLTSEDIGAKGDVNRQRKLRAQIRDAANFAEQVENGENRFYNVGFLFSLKAKSVAELNKLTSQFKALAGGKNIGISSCFAVQAEAYAQNAPLNNSVVIGSQFIRSEAIKWHQMDKRSVSAIYNYTQSSYTHTTGIPLGRDMFTAAPVLFDLYHPSHDGYTLIIAGKTRSGKSATIKMMCCRQLIQGYHFVSIDSQERKGLSEGEYAGLATLCDGVNFKISNNADEVMNIFEVGETITTVKTEDNHIEKVRTLELKDKITMVVYILLMMIRGDAKAKEDGDPLSVYMKGVLTENVEQMYTQTFGIRDGDPDSLYTNPGNPLALDRGISTGRPAKRQPTITDLYKQLLVSERDNKDVTLKEAYNVIRIGLRDYVKELYYSEDTRRPFTAEEVSHMNFNEGGSGRVYINDRNKRENVVEIHGIKSYYDGQSSVHISRDCPYTNIDISGLPEKERKLARQVAVDFVNENFIKKNSDDISSAANLVVICDECHEMFSNDYTRETLNNAVRTARKRNVGIILSSQTLKEYDKHSDTREILSQAAVKFIFKQDFQDMQYLMDTLGLTQNQVGFIVNSLGGNVSDDSDGNRHRGEMCIIDNKQVSFSKVDYRKDTEALPVETDAAGIEEIFKAAI